MSAETPDSFTLSREDFTFFQKKIFEKAGITLSDGKLDLVQSRLRSRVLALGLQGFRSYRDHLSSRAPQDPEWEYFINQLTTNKTDWFREDEHFNFLVNEYLPLWKRLGKKHLRVWCAASSTGEEPYTLSMVLHKAFLSSEYTFEIVATDIDTRVLEHAMNGVYPLSGLELIPEVFHDFAFVPGTKEISGWMKVRKEIKKNVEFLQVNLTDLPALGKKFDLIFCRNVLIYFSPETILEVVDSMFDEASNDCMLVIAHSESLQNIPTKWKYVRPSIYRKGSHFSELIN